MGRDNSESGKYLAQGPGCEVVWCTHGVVHITLGGFTAHISQPEFEVMCETLLSALCQLQMQKGLNSRHVAPMV